MIIDVGDTIFYKDDVLKVVEIERDFFLDGEILTFFFENDGYMNDGSLMHRELLNDYVKDGRYIISKAKYRENRINQILENE
jgi:hypothetical protein